MSQKHMITLLTQLVPPIPLFPDRSNKPLKINIKCYI
jgi:hypothetical protein